MTPMNHTHIKKALRELSLLDPHIAAAVELVGTPKPRIRPAGFTTLFNTIVSQQISTEAAAAIIKRVHTLVPDLTAKAILNKSDNELRAAGLSYRKIEYAKGLARAIEDQSFPVNRLDKLTDGEAIQEITALRGFGRWSAEIYLMFSLKRRDIFPADDLALQIALQKLKGLSERPTAKQARQLTEHWSPYRSVGSLFLWHYYRGAPN